MNSQALPLTGQHTTCHTPGPWRLEPCSHGGAILVRGDGKHGAHPQTHLQVVPIEDARLIAAAPDLLTALERFAIVGGDTVNPATLFQMTGADVLAARTAIRAATGG